MNLNLVRAKRDITDCQNISIEEQALLTENAPLEIELTDADLENIFGGGGGPLGGLSILEGLTKILGGA